MQRKNHHGIRFGAKLWAACACVAICTVCWGQDIQLQTSPRRHGQPPQTAQASVPSHANQPFTSPTSAPSLLDRPPKPATVDLAAGHLTIQADNSSLIDILGQVTAASGMTIEGLGQDQRIFGSYGPGKPPEVILALLHGLGYNVVMVGETAKGTPKLLTLSPRVAGVSNGPNRLQQPRQQDEDSDDEVPAQPVLIDPATQQQQQQLPTPPQGPPGGVRTPQQMLQELQQMRQQQQQQQQQQQAPQ